MRVIGLVAALAAMLCAHASRAEILVGGDDPACKAAVALSDARRGAELLVLRNGKPICEAYSGEGAPDQRMGIWSGTKPLVGMMMAAAVQDGLLTLDEKVAATLPEWRADPRKSRATLRHLLTLSAGLGGQPATEYAEAVALPLQTEPGEVFAYGGPSLLVFGEVMKRKLAAAGQPADPYLYVRRRLLDPLGLGGATWERTPGGDPQMALGVTLTAREWARFGEFVRAGGVVNGKPLVDPDTFRQLFVSSAANPEYGVTWWLPHPPRVMDPISASTDIGLEAGKLPPDLVMSTGIGDQRLYVIPSRHLTIVRLGSYSVAWAMEHRGKLRPPPWPDTEFLLLLLRTASGE